MNKDFIKAQNEIIEKWGSKVIRSLKTEVSSMFPGNSNSKSIGKVLTPRNFTKTRSFTANDSFVMKTPKLKNSIRSKFLKYGTNEIEGVSITFARHGIFVIKGAGPGDREPKDFLNPTMDKEVPELADKITEINADAEIKILANIIKKENG